VGSRNWGRPSRKAAWWDLHLASLLMHFVCAVMDFSAAEKDSGVKLCMLVRLLSGMSFSYFGEVA